MGARLHRFGMITLQQRYLQFKQSLATGLNRAAVRFQSDIQEQVPIRTGKLRAGYRVNKQATPSDLSVRIGPSERYGANWYPFKARFGKRQAQRPTGARLFGAGRSSAGRRGRVIREEIRRAMREGG
jgi:hypothetical protein